MPRTKATSRKSVPGATVIRSAAEIRELLEECRNHRGAFGRGSRFTAADATEQTLRWLFGGYSPSHPGNHADDEIANEFVRNHAAVAKANMRRAGIV
jgi:hypothetical protein